MYSEVSPTRLLLRPRSDTDDYVGQGVGVLALITCMICSLGVMFAWLITRSLLRRSALALIRVFSHGEVYIMDVPSVPGLFMLSYHHCCDKPGWEACLVGRVEGGR